MSLLDERFEIDQLPETVDKALAPNENLQSKILSLYDTVAKDPNVSAVLEGSNESTKSLSDLSDETKIAIRRLYELVLMQEYAKLSGEAINFREKATEQNKQTYTDQLRQVINIETSMTLAQLFQKVIEYTKVPEVENEITAENIKKNILSLVEMAEYIDRAFRDEEILESAATPRNARVLALKIREFIEGMPTNELVKLLDGDYNLTLEFIRIMAIYGDEKPAFFRPVEIDILRISYLAELSVRIIKQNPEIRVKEFAELMLAEDGNLSKLELKTAWKNTVMIGQEGEPRTRRKFYRTIDAPQGNIDQD